MITYETTWLPSDWMDEYTPETLRHPNDFIHQQDDGTYIITPKVGKDDLQPTDFSHFSREMKAGDVIRFSPSECYGTFTLYVSDDLSFWIDGDYPSKANCFYEPDSEAVTDSLSELVEIAGDDGGCMTPGSYTVKVYWWGNDIAYRFDIAPDGKPHFVEVGEVH